MRHRGRSCFQQTITPSLPLQSSFVWARMLNVSVEVSPSHTDPYINTRKKKNNQEAAHDSCGWAQPVSQWEHVTFVWQEVGGKWLHHALQNVPTEMPHQMVLAIWIPFCIIMVLLIKANVDWLKFKLTRLGQSVLHSNMSDHDPRMYSTLVTIQWMVVDALKIRNWTIPSVWTVRKS